MTTLTGFDLSSTYFQKPTTPPKPDYAEVRTVASNEDNPEPFKFEKISQKEGTPQEEVVSDHTEATKTDSQNISVNASEPTNSTNDATEEFSTTYRQLLRKPIMNEIRTSLDQYVSSLGQPEAAMYYSQVKENIEKVWPYMSEDEPSTIALATIESVMKLNKWRNIEKHQAKVLISAINMIVKENVNLADVKNITINLQRTGLDMFPHEE